MAVHVAASGLSPQVRGNLDHPRVDPGRRGPIPAGAGEPCPVVSAALVTRAYPRRCGGTTRMFLMFPLSKGLSPQVRGNLLRLQNRRLLAGPIPAGAGEPAADCALDCAARAYPRRCGGTEAMAASCSCRAGLSPQVRGNRRGGVHGVSPSGPIPAGAGEPCRRFRRPAHSGAYPRRCGGTAPIKATCCTVGGLSPQVRGNHAPPMLEPERIGPIPAGAGEPRACSRRPAE